LRGWPGQPEFSWWITRTWECSAATESRYCGDSSVEPSSTNGFAVALDDRPADRPNDRRQQLDHTFAEVPLRDRLRGGQQLTGLDVVHAQPAPAAQPLHHLHLQPPPEDPLPEGTGLGPGHHALDRLHEVVEVLGPVDPAESGV
jgi:hypothetical protein